MNRNKAEARSEERGQGGSAEEGVKEETIRRKSSLLSF